MTHLMSTAQLAPARPSARDAFSVTLFKLFGIERIHIIGCSRSGTTMLHLAMGCFSGVTLAPTETTPGYPWMLDRLKLALRVGWRPERKYFITKRDYGWFEPANVEDLIQKTRLENIGLIHLVRDPRDVMLSRYVGSSRDASGQPYVSEAHWYDSISAADRVFDALKDHPRKFVLRYEDIVLNTASAEAQIARAFGMTRNRDALPMDRVKDNFERLRIPFSRATLRNLGGLRNMDSKSVGKWREADVVPVAETLSPPVRARFEAFCAEHGYH